MEQKDQNTTPTQTVTNEDNDVEMGSSPETTNIQEQEIVEQGQEQEQVTEIPIEGPATSNDEMNVEEEVKEEVKEEKEEIDPPSTVAVIDTAAMEKTWKEEFNNLVKRLKNDRPPNEALEETLEILCDEFEPHINAEPLNIKEELTNRLRPRGLFIIKEGYLKQIAEGILDRGNLDTDGQNLTYQVGYQIIGICSTFLLDSSYVSILSEAVHALLNTNSTFNGRYGKGAYGTSPVFNFFNQFKAGNGYGRLYTRVNNKRRPLSLSDVRWAFSLVEDSPGNNNETREAAESLLVALEHRLMSVTPEDLSTEPRGTSTELLRIMGVMFRRPGKKGAAGAAGAASGSDATTDCENMITKIYSQCSLHLAELLVDFSGMFEKKHAGLREIGYWVQEETFAKDVAQWLHEKHILQRVLYDVSVHAEFVRKSRDLISLQAKHGCLGAEEIDLIWRFCTAENAEDNKNIMLENIAHESANFKPDVFSAFEERFSSLPDEAFFGNITFDAICAFVSKELSHDGTCAKRRTNLEKHRAKLVEQKNDNPEFLERISDAIANSAFDVKPACLERIWAGTLDGSAALSSASAEIRAVEYLSNIFKLAKNVRPEVYEKYQTAAVENVRGHKSVWQSLYFLVNSLDGNNTEIQLYALNSQHHLIEAFIEECTLFKREAANVSDDNDVLPGTRVPYSGQVGFRFDFATRLLSEAKQIQLGKQEVGVLWDLFVTNARTRSEIAAVLKFFVGIAQKSGEVFDKETSQFLFPGMAETFNFRVIGDTEYDFVSYFFMFLNWKEGFYAQNNMGQWVVKNYPGLVGLDVLWRIALETEDEGVGKNAIDAIFGYISTLSEEEIPNMGVYKEGALERCVGVLCEEAAKPAESVYDVRIIRALTIIRMILEGFEVQNPHKDLLIPKKKKPKTNTNNISQGAGDNLTAAGEKVTVHIKTIATKECFTLKDVEMNATAERILERLARENPSVSPHARLVCAGKKFEDYMFLSSFFTGENSQNKEISFYYVKKMEPQGNTAIKGLPETSAVLKASTYEALARILVLPGIASGVCLRILSLLPTDPSLLRALDALYEGTTTEWNAIITGGRRLLYVLPVLAKYLDVVYPKFNAEDWGIKEEKKEEEEEDPDHRKAAWRSSFIRTGGFVRLVKAFNEMEYEKLHQSDALEEADKKYKSFKYDKGPGANYAKWCYILHDTVRIIAWFITTKATAEAAAEALFGGDAAGVGKAFLEQLFRMTKTLASAYNLFDFGFGIYNEIFRGCIDILTTLLRWPCGGAVEAVMDEYISHNRDAISAWIRTMLVDCTCLAYRSSAEGLTLALAERHKDGEEAESKLIVQFLIKLLPEVSTVGASTPESTKEDLTPKGENYFNVLLKLLSAKEGDINEESSLMEEGELLSLFAQVTSYVKARPVMEEDFGKGEFGGDSVLQGLLRLATMLAPRIGSGDASNTAREELFLEVLRNCLFAAPSADAKDHVPKCKKEKSRQIAHDLLLALSRAGLSEGFVEKTVADDLSDGIDYLSEDDLPRGALFVDGAVRNAHSYSGLHNQGATCYMNSTLQQFFMVPEFRRAILEIDIKELDEKKANVPFFKALQKLFLAMQESQHVAQKTKEFTNTLGDDFKPYVQMDAIEFLGNFIGTIENGVKGTPYKNITDVFTAKTCDEIIPRGCPHVRENVAMSTTIQVDVKGKRSVEESLENWVRGELLDGDNKCMCEACNEKRDTLKRPCFLEGPPMLILHLRRFEFSYETFTNFKVNDEFHFPLTLSLHPYTKKGLHEKEDAAAAARGNVPKEGSEGPKENVDEDEYELVGVVAHRGTTNSGHYYSFIKERTENGKWFEFNDSTVSVFNENNLANECFGGSEQRTYNNNTTTVPKTNNAYILFYKKKSWDSNEKHAREGDVETLSKNARKAYDRLWEENRSFITGIDMCDSAFVEFVKKMYVEPNIVNQSAIYVVQKTLLSIMAHVPNGIPQAKSNASSSLQNDDKDFMKDVNAMDVEDDDEDADKKASPSATEDGKEEEEKKEGSNFQLFVDYLKGAYKNIEYAEGFITEFTGDEDDFSYVSEYILEHANKEVRKAYADIVYTALMTLINSGDKAHQKEAGKFIYSYVKLMNEDTVEKNWKSFAEYFYLIKCIAESTEYCSSEVKRLTLGVMNTANLLWHLASICADDEEIQKAEKLKVTRKMSDKYSSVDVSPVAEAAAVFMRAASAVGIETNGLKLFGIQSIYNTLTEGCCTEAAMIADSICGDSAGATEMFVSSTLRAVITEFFRENMDSKTINDDFCGLFKNFRTGFLAAPNRSDDVLAVRGEMFGNALIESVLELFNSRDVVEAFLIASNTELVSVPGIRKSFLDNVDKWLMKMLFRVFRGRCREEGYKLLTKILMIPEKDLASTQPLISDDDADGVQEGESTKAYVCKVFGIILENVKEIFTLVDETKVHLRPVRLTPIIKMLYQTLRYEGQAKALFASEYYGDLISLLNKANSYDTDKPEAKYFIVKLIHEALAAVPDATAEAVRLTDIKAIINSWKVRYPSPESCTVSPDSNDEYVLKVSGLCAMLQALFDFVHLLGTRFGPIFEIATSGAFTQFCGNVLFNPDFAPAKTSFMKILPTPDGAPEDYKVYMSKVIGACLEPKSPVPFDAALNMLEDPATFGEAVKNAKALAGFVVKNFEQNKMNTKFLGFVKRVFEAETTPIGEYDTLMPAIVTAAMTAGLKDDADREVIEGIKDIWNTFIKRDPEYPIIEAAKEAGTKKISGMNKTLLGVISDSLNNDMQKYIEKSANEDGEEESMDIDYAIEEGARYLALLSVYIDSEKYLETLTKDACLKGIKPVEFGINFVKTLLVGFETFEGRNLSECKAFNLIMDTAFNLTSEERMGINKYLNPLCAHIETNLNNYSNIIGALTKIKVTLGSSKTLANLFIELEPEFMTTVMGYLTEFSKSDIEGPIAAQILQALNEYGINLSNGDDDDSDDDGEIISGSDSDVDI